MRPFLPSTFRFVGPCLFHVSWSDKCLFQGTRNSGQHMNQDEVPKTELEMACCSWWMRRHSRAPITLGKNIGGKWSYISRSVLFCVTLFIRKADGLIVALSGNLERPLVGQSGTFVEPGSANLITFEVSTILHQCKSAISDGCSTVLLEVGLGWMGWDGSLNRNKYECETVDTILGVLVLVLVLVLVIIPRAGPELLGQLEAPCLKVSENL